MKSVQAEMEKAPDRIVLDALNVVMEFMVDCTVMLNHSVVHGISQRSLRVQKYCGSSFDEDESPFVIGKRGLEVCTRLREASPP